MIGIIEEWPKDCSCSARIFAKVRDEGSYTLQFSNRDPLHFDGVYVPNGLIPGGYGDYIELDIDEHGRITNWPEKVSVRELLDEVIDKLS